MIGIYCIEHIESGKKYIGKSVNIKRRLAAHKCTLTKTSRSKKHCNNYLYSAVQKYGWNSFRTYVLQSFNEVNEKEIAKAELYWMDKYDTCNIGYNLRRDSGSKMICHHLTRKLQSENNQGSKNPNFDNSWSQEQKDRMSIIAKNRHSSGVYGKEWKKKLSKASSETWKNEEIKSKMAKNVSKSKQKYNFLQYLDGRLIRTWSSVKEITDHNPTYKWQNIYAVCNGNKPSIYGFKWVKELKI
jgi:group I intron endonuclease